LVDQWKSKQNRQASATVQLTAVVLNMFRAQGAAAIDPTSFLPFPPQLHYSSLEQSEEALGRFFGRIGKAIEVTANGQ